MQTKQLLGACIIVSMLLLSIVSISALTAREAKQNWLDAKENSKELQKTHREAKQTHGPQSEGAVETGKDVLNAALDEVESWLIWKEEETNENDELPQNLKDDIYEDIETNKDKIDSLRDEVDAIDTPFALGITFLRMIGKYTELLTDVSRDSGKIWVHIANKRIENLESLEARIRNAAEDLDDNDEIIEKLDIAQEKISEAKEHIGHADGLYEDVRTGKTPLITFHEGNQHLRYARASMLEAHIKLNQALRMILQHE